MPSLSFKFFTYSDAKNSSSSIRKVENTQFLHKLIDQSVHSKSQLLLPIVLMVPKREIFVTELFTLSDPIWIGDIRIGPKKLFV
jgi:hypothetical protein